MSHPRDHQWNTESELEFVKGLGTFNLPRTVRRSREWWLLAYHETMFKRQEWGKIDRDVVEKAVLDELFSLCDKESPCP